jgi:hypothetical protein
MGTAPNAADAASADADDSTGWRTVQLRDQDYEADPSARANPVAVRGVFTFKTPYGLTRDRPGVVGGRGRRSRPCRNTSGVEASA